MSIDHIKLEISDVIPSASGFKNSYQDLLELLVPEFRRNVAFALVEILQLDLVVSDARTFAYFDRSELDFMKLKDDYFAIIDGLFDDTSMSISSARNFYFDEKIYFTRIEGPDAPYLAKGEFSWFGPAITSPRRDYKQLIDIPIEVMDDAYERYVNGLRDTILAPYPVSYILLIPVSLNHINNEFQSPIGAAFLHFGLREPIVDERAFASEAVRGLNLYFHYNLTAESLHKRKALLEETEADLRFKDNELSRAKSVQPHLFELDQTLVKLRTVNDSIRSTLLDQPFENATRAFEGVCRLSDSCFPRKYGHNPRDHRDLSAITRQRNGFIDYLRMFISELTKSGLFNQESAAELVEPILDVTSGTKSSELANCGDDPHPSLCLCKSLSHTNRFPLAWILICFDQRANWHDWQKYVRIEANDTRVTLLRAIRMFIYETTFSFDSINDVDRKLTILGTPKWDDYEEFYHAAINQLSSGGSEGSTARQLVRLRNFGFQIDIAHAASGESKVFHSEQDEPSCFIRISRSKVELQVSQCLPKLASDMRDSQ